MAGSLNHCLTEDREHYRGAGLLDHMGDAGEAIDEMMFIILSIRHRWGGGMIIDHLVEQYGRCVRGEQPWPDFMQPGIEADL